MILRLFFTFFTLILISCTVKKKEIVLPAGIISPDSMAVILADMHSVEALITHGLLINNNPSATAFSYYEGVYLQNKISRERFEESYNFYRLQPALLKEIYNKVIEELSSRQGALKAAGLR